uniref:Ras-related protein Rab-26 n=1 Tax=Macrostomum lignano TaxID=282301 RepID=A0A1I8FEZ3_9PLAT
ARAGPHHPSSCTCCTRLIGSSETRTRSSAKPWRPARPALCAFRQQQQPASSRLLQQSHLAESALRICDCDPNYPNSGRRMDSCDLDSDNPRQRHVDSARRRGRRQQLGSGSRRRRQGSRHRRPDRARSSGYYSRQSSSSALAAGRATARHSRQLQQQPLNSESEAGEDAAEEELYRLREYDIIQPEQQQQQQSRIRRSVSRQVAQNFDEDADEQAGLDVAPLRLPSSPGRVTDSLQRSQECLSGHSAITNVPRRDRRGGGGAGSRRQKPESSPGRQAAAGQEASTSCAIVTVSGNPERMFKVVLAGDAAVGKSKLHHEAVRQPVHGEHTATLGVDFKTKIIAVDGAYLHCRWVHIIKLWDTAGQERFRSVAKSYFSRRRPMASCWLFDCTYERSFLSVREMGRSGARGCGQIRAIMILLEQDGLLRLAAQQQGKRVVEYTEARKLAQEYDALFCRGESRKCRVSAKTMTKEKECKRKIGLLRFLDSDLGRDRPTP